MNISDQWEKAEHRFELWRMRCYKSQTLHHATGRLYSRLHYLIGVLTVTFSASLATLGFVGIGGSLNQTIVILIAILGSISTTLSAIQTFLNYGSRAEEHQRKGFEFGEIGRDIEAILATPYEDRKSIEFEVSEISTKMNVIASDAPTIPDSILKTELKKQSLLRKRNMQAVYLMPNKNNSYTFPPEILTDKYSVESVDYYNDPDLPKSSTIGSR